MGLGSGPLGFVQGLATTTLLRHSIQASPSMNPKKIIKAIVFYSNKFLESR